MSEYTHMQELLHESRRLLAEAEKRHDERYASNLETMTGLRAEIERLQAELLEAQDTIHGCELVIDNQKAIIDRNAWGDSRTSDGGLDGANTADYGPFTPQLVCKSVPESHGIAHLIRKMVEFSHKVSL